MKLLLPVIEPGAFARGICASSAAATGLIRPAGIWLLANCVRVHTPCALQVVVSGSKIGMSAPAALKVCEKSPARCRSVGTVVVDGNGISS